jgi:hypothetical protein
MLLSLGEYLVPGKLTSTMADGPGDGAEVVVCCLQKSTVNGSFGVLPPRTSPKTTDNGSTLTIGS